MTTSRRWLLGLSALGVLDTIYLTIVHFQAGALVCSSSGVVDCHAVLSSAYSVIAGVPTSVYGLIWFGVIGLLVWKQPHWSAALRLISWLGALVVIALVYVELFLVGAICVYCSIAHLLVLAILVIVEWHQGRLAAD
jgi:uncharacterized membrane protein